MLNSDEHSKDSLFYVFC